MRTAAARLLPAIGASSRVAQAQLLRAMNSYYSNKIEGQHTYPADLEQAPQQQFSADQDVRRRQELAIAHMRVEELLEAEAIAWAGHFSSDWVKRIHRELHQRLDEESRVIVDEHGKPRGVMVPVEFRVSNVKVQYHEAPPPEMLSELMAHFEFRYRDETGETRKQAEYYAALAAADLRRRNNVDGRGNLTSKGLAEFIEFWLQICLDQVSFMGEMLALESLQERFVALALQVLYDYPRCSAAPCA